MTNDAVAVVENKEAVFVDLSGNALTELNDPLLFSGMTVLTRLYLYYNRLGSLHPKLFTSLTAVNILDLSDNQLTTMQDTLFATLTSMTTLSLANNLLGELPSTLFTGLLRLHQLYLNGNGFKELDSSVFSSLTSLTQLKLDNNLFSKLQPKLFASLTALDTLDLHDNKLQGFEDDPAIFSTLTAMTRLDLSTNMLHELQTPVFTRLKRLTALYLNSNMLKVLVDPQLFSSLTALTDVLLNSNQLIDLHPKLFISLTALRHLDLGYNKLQQLADPNIFATLTALTSLTLKNNLLSDLQPTLFANLTRLEDLSLTGNSLQELADAEMFLSLVALKRLFLDYNALTYLDPELFTSLTNVTVLSLRSNKLQGFEDPIIFSTMTALMQLDLDNNHLHELQPTLFANLTALMQLTLDNNLLHELQPTLFANLTRLYTLTLRNNLLTSLNSKLFTSLTSLDQLDLSKNSLTMIDSPTFSPVVASIGRLIIAENNIERIDAVLDEMHQYRLVTLKMDGNPSECSIATRTNENVFGSIVCKCAEGLERIPTVNANGLVINSNVSRPGPNIKLSASTGYLCQIPTHAVIVAQSTASLRSSKFLLRGPPEQMSTEPGDDQILDNLRFAWNHVIVDESSVVVTMKWVSNSEAKLKWTCMPNSTCDGLGNITHPPANIPTSLIGQDNPQGVPASVTYFVNSTTAKDKVLRSEIRRTSLNVVYSAFYLPGRFDNAVNIDQANNNYAVQVIAGSGLLTSHALRINETITRISAADDIDKEIRRYEWLQTTANVAVEKNSAIATSISFQLAYNDCYEMYAADVLKVQPIYSAHEKNRNSINGWEVVVGDPIEMFKANISTMKPCRAMLQAYDAITNEILNVTTVEASVQDCFDNGNLTNTADTGFLSCTGHGTCKHDPHPYDGTFAGCDCIGLYGGRRCGVKLQKCADDEGFNVYEGACIKFVPKLNQNPLAPTIPGQDYFPLTKANNYTVESVEGNTVRTPGVELNETESKFSSGGKPQVRFKLSDSAPPSFFVSGVTGEISAYLTLNNSIEAQHVYDFQLLAQDDLGATAVIRRMQFRVNRKPPEPPNVAVPTVVGCTALAVVLSLIVHKLRGRHIAKKDAIAALVRAQKAYGLVNLEYANHGVSVNSGDLVGITTTNAAFVGLQATPDSDSVLLLDHANGYNNDQMTYEDDDDDNYADGNNEEGGMIGQHAGINEAPGSGVALKRRPGLSKFVAPTMSLGKSTLAAKGLDVLLGVDPKTYMHVKNKVKVMLKEFAKNGTDEDNMNLKTLIEGTYKHPPNGDGSPLTADDIRGQSMTMDELMACSNVQDAGLERHHVLALRLYTTSTFRSINNPMRQSPPTLPHPFAATLYYISDALSKLREVQGKDAAMRNETLVFWRGMKDLQITNEFIRTGGSEMACMSTTSDQSVAVDFALSRSPLLFKLVSKSFMSHGADISFLSVYPGEAEVLFPPLTYLRPIKMTEETIGTVVYKVVEVEPVFPK